MRIANMGADADAAAITFDVGRYTGFRPAKDTMSQFQRGPRPESREGTAVQMQGTDIGIWIDSDSPRPEKGSLLPVCPAYWWLDETRAPRPFQEPDRELAFSFEMQVPTAERQGQAEVYVCAISCCATSGRAKPFGWAPRCSISAASIGFRTPCMSMTGKRGPACRSCSRP